MDYLLTWADGNGHLVKFRLRISNLLIKVTLRFVRLAVFVVKKKFCFKYFECLFVDFVMQQAKRMRLFIF